MTRPLCTCGHALAQHELDPQLVSGRWSAMVDAETGELVKESGPCLACGSCQEYSTKKTPKLSKRELARLALRVELAGLQVDVDERRTDRSRTHLGPLSRELLSDPVQRAASSQAEHVERMIGHGWRPAALELPPPPPGCRYVAGVVEPLLPPAQAGFFDDLL